MGKLPLPHVDNCLFCIDLKIGTIIICIYTIFVAGGASGYVSRGPCLAALGSPIVKNLAYCIYVANVVLIIAAILMLLYIFFNWDELAISCTIYVWACFIACVLTIVVCVLQYVLASQFAKENCKWIGYLVFMVVESLIWLYLACVVNSFCGDA